MKSNVLRVCILFILSVYSLTIFAQETKSIMKNRPGQIFLHNGDVIDYKSIEQTEKGFAYLLEGGEESKSIEKSNIYEIFQEQGSYAAEYGAAGALGGLLGSLLGTMDWDQNETLKDSKGAFIVGGTIAGALIGGISGAFVKKNRLVFTAKEDEISLLPTFSSFCNVPNSSSYTLGLGVKVIF